MKREAGKVTYYGRCDRCNTRFDYPSNGEKACRWGGCNGTVKAMEQYVIPDWGQERLAPQEEVGQ